MESVNNTTEAVSVREMVTPLTIAGEVLVITRLVVSVLVLLVNGVIAVAFLAQKVRRPTSVVLSPAGLLVVNLLLADALVGVVTIENILTQSNSMILWRYWCSIRLGVSYLVMIGSHIALINVAIDRYIAIVYTLYYRDYMTMGRSVTIMCVGWIIPVAGAVGAVATNTWRPGLSRCSDISSFRMFLLYLWVPSHIVALLCVILIQCRVYIVLRHHERENTASNQILRRFSQKSAKILFRVTTTFVLCWGPFDAALVAIVIWFTPVLKTVYDVTLIFAQLSFLVNPLIYSYQTENIRRPVSDLYSDIKKWMWRDSHSQANAHARTSDVSVIRTISPFQKSTSVSSMQSTSGYII